MPQLHKSLADRRRFPALLCASMVVVFGVAAGAAAKEPTPPPPNSPSADMEAGRALFGQWGCAQCHTLHDAGASGIVGPSFDGNPGLNEALVLDRVGHGRGDMPSFAGMMSDEDMRALAAYLVGAARPPR